MRHQVFTGEFAKSNMSTPVRVHCRADGGPCFSREVRVVLVSVDTKGGRKWYGLLADSELRSGASVTNAAAEFILASCRMQALPLLPGDVTWFQRDTLSRFDRIRYHSRGVDFSPVTAGGAVPSSRESFLLTLKEGGVPVECDDVANAVEWAVA